MAQSLRGGGKVARRRKLHNGVLAQPQAGKPHMQRIHPRVREANAIGDDVAPAAGLIQTKQEGRVVKGVCVLSKSGAAGSGKWPVG